MTERLDNLLAELGVSDFLEAAADATLGRNVAVSSSKETAQSQPERLARLAFVYETKALSVYDAWVSRRAPEGREAVSEAFRSAFRCWRALAWLPEDDGKIERDVVSTTGVSVAEKFLPDELLPPGLLLAFRLAVSGLGAAHNAETRLELERFPLVVDAKPSAWKRHLAQAIARALVLLTRKGSGWDEVHEGIHALQALRELQQNNEPGWLDAKVPHQQAEAASELVGLYHLAQIVTLSGHYLIDGTVPGKRGGALRLNSRLDLHRSRAVAAFRAARSVIAEHFGQLVWVACRELVHNSIWTHVEGLGADLVELARELAHATKPVIELWPAQQAALQQRLLDPYPRAILVEMPTSAGKTLLAKFAMIQAHALAKGTIAYVVPTRALVNQVTLELRRDFRRIGLTVEQTVPAFEMDPTEAKLLHNIPDVLVSTPEKLDFLIRKDHPVSEKLIMVVADEAHNLSDRNRGPRLELLLGTVKRDRPGVRFLLLSPFLPEADDLLPWLGEDRTIPPIRVNWRPSRRVVGALRGAGAARNRRLVLETLPAADNADTRAGLRLPLTSERPAQELGTIKGIVSESVQALWEKGGVLVLCRGPGTCMTRAEELADSLPPCDETPELTAACHYLEAEFGRKPAIVEYLKHGVAYHHAGLSLESRILIESLIRRQQVRVVCGTTTLAQGVNFPISTVIVESLKKGDQLLTYADFWNIAGRAGRTLIDSVGVVGFPTPNGKKREEWEEFLVGEAEAISSQLASLVDRVDEIGETFNVNTIFNFPELSPLLQFLAHAMRIAGSTDLAAELDELEEVLRASLVYHQVEKARGRAAVDNLVELCRNYLSSIRGLNTGTLVLADQTGFATPSVLSMLARKSDVPGLSSAEQWDPNVLFGNNIDPLTERISAIAFLPEMRLGADDSGQFSAERVARIIRDWVGGMSLESMARQYARLPVDRPFDPERDTAQFSRYLFSRLLGRAAWGIGALEGVCLAGSSDDVWGRVGYVPSMVYFGVRQREAVWLRMVGVPRLAAEPLALLWREEQRPDPDSYDGIRKWVSTLSEKRWADALPANTPLTPADMQWIWSEFAGH